jgi:hypothetical protein
MPKLEIRFEMESGSPTSSVLALELNTALKAIRTNENCDLVGKQLCNPDANCDLMGEQLHLKMCQWYSMRGA